MKLVVLLTPWGRVVSNPVCAAVDSTRRAKVLVEPLAACRMRTLAAGGSAEDVWRAQRRWLEENVLPAATDIFLSITANSVESPDGLNPLLHHRDPVYLIIDGHDELAMAVASLRSEAWIRQGAESGEKRNWETVPGPASGFRPRIEPHRIVEAVSLIRRGRRYAGSIVGAAPAARFFYEDFADGTADVIRQILSHCGWPDAQFKTRAVNIISGNLSDSVSNAEELLEEGARLGAVTRLAATAGLPASAARPPRADEIEAAAQEPAFVAEYAARIHATPPLNRRRTMQELDAFLPTGMPRQIAGHLVRTIPSEPLYFVLLFEREKDDARRVSLARLVLQVAAPDPEHYQHPVTIAASVLVAARPELVTPQDAENARHMLLRATEHSDRHRYYKAILASRGGDRDGALALLDEHLRDFPQDEQAAVLRAQICFNSGRWGTHFQAFAALRAFPGSKEAMRIYDTVAGFLAAQGIAPENAHLHPRELETPGAVYEHVIAAAPPPSPEHRSGIVMACGSLAGGGAERVVANLFREISRIAGEEVMLWLFSRSGTGSADPLFYLNLTGTTADRITYLDDHVAPQEPFSWLPVFYAQKAQQMYVKLMERKPRLVHLSLDETVVGCGIAAVMAGVPEIVIHCHNMSPPVLHGEEERSFGWDRAYRALLSRPNVRFINVCKAATEDYIAWADAGQYRERCTFVYNGIDLSGIPGPEQWPALRESVRQALDIPRDAPVIGTGIRFSEVKQPLAWVRAARAIKDRVPDAHFICYGDGELLLSAKALAASLGLADAIRFPGRVNDLLQRLPAFDVVLLTSRSEGFPNILVEAQASSAVPVSFDVGGCRETMTPGETGFVTPPQDVEALARQITSLLTDRALLQRMRQQGQQFVRTSFSFDAMMDRMSDIIFPPGTLTAEPA